ncbi:unnamed protein product [Oikopleura dioica]|uniref:DH domain-containing protein n=1 Tax=Oikopleura dioica TaxID=34765 RepID=E4YQB8_OIKDI|nr:unnamed protein product [Oikopleura dioica]
MCCKLEREWNELIQGLNERSKILKEASSFWEGRDNFQWQCDAWIRHMQDLLEACHRRTGFESTTDYETLAINAEEFCTMCHQLHKSVASSGKKLLAFLQDTTDDDKRIKLDMSSSVEIICEALDELLSLRDRVRDCAETSRKIAAFYLDAEKVSKWINKLGRPFLDKSTSIGKSQERATKLLERHAEFERVCQNTYSNVEKLLSTGHSLTTQFEQYHSFIGNKCQTLKDLTDAFQTEVRARRELLEAAVSFYTKVKEIWKIFDELRVQRDGQGDVQQFERNRSDVKVAMKITVSEGAYLVARLKRSDPYAEQHILDIVHSIEKGQGQLNSQLATDQARLEAAKARVEWEKEVDEQCEKLQKWRLNYQKSGNRDTQGRSDFGHLIQELNAFKIKEQGKCFDLGRAGRDLLMIRGENIDKTEEYLQKLSREQRLFEQLVEETQNYLEHQGQMEEALNIYLPAAKEKIAPPPIRENVDAIFGNIRELLAFHEDFYSQLQLALEVDDIAHCFVINADRLCQLYVDYCKGRERSTEIIANESEGYFAGVHLKKNAPQPLNSCLIWPVQRIPKYTMLLRELQDCSIGSAHSKSKLQEALKMVEDIPRKANDAIHLAMLQHSSVPRSELILQGQVILKNEKILPMQKNRERHCFLFETAAIICKKAESTKEYIPKYSISTRKMTWELSDGTISINGSGNRAVFRPLLKPDAEEWALRLKQVCSSAPGRYPSNESSPKKANTSNISTSSVPPPMNLFRSLPRPLKNKNSISDDFSLSKNSLEI